MLSSHELLKKAIEIISKVLWITWVFKPEAIVKLAENVQLFTAGWVFNTLGPLGFHVSRGLNLIYYVTTFELYGKYLMMYPGCGANSEYGGLCVKTSSTVVNLWRCMNLLVLSFTLPFFIDLFTRLENATQGANSLVFCTEEAKNKP